MKEIIESGQAYAFLQWMRKKVRASEQTPVFPSKKEDIEKYRMNVRKILEEAAGHVPEYDSLDAEIHQKHERDSYFIEAVSFHTFSGLRMTANAYIPKADRPVPGILAVHGHSMHGRRDQRMQKRCAALAKSGYFVLAVDAFGNGERSVDLPGCYHGNNYAGALWLTGHSLFGVQIHENYRACDYLTSRPEVDEGRLGISGASGGGNQSFYSGAWDKRFKAVVPVCSSGAYFKMLGTENCVCETPFGVAGKLEQYDVFSLIAPRALLVISAKGDGVSFRFEDAGNTMEKASEVWEMLGYPQKIEFAPLPINHGYPPEARAFCLQWFNRWLKGDEGGTLPEEPETTVEDYSKLSCYPAATTSQVMTMPVFFNKKRTAALSIDTEISRENAGKIFSAPEAREMEAEPVSRILELIPGTTGFSRVFRTTDGIIVPALCYYPDYTHKAERTIIIAGNRKEDNASVHSRFIASTFEQKAIENNFALWIVDLPGLGEGMFKNDNEGCRTAARACHMLGFSLAGFWLSILKTLAHTAGRESGNVWLYASGTPATAVLAGAFLLKEFENIITYGAVASYRHFSTFENLPFAALIPGILKEGDIPDFASLRAPLPLTVAAPVSADGNELSVKEMLSVFVPLLKKYQSLNKPEDLHLITSEESKSTYMPDLFFKK